jgi:hypothetical protein
VIIEALSFKLSLDFLQYLKKNKISTSDIKLSFWDRSSYEYITFSDIKEMLEYFDSQYKPIDDCLLGSLCSLQVFSGESFLYDFRTEYKAINIVDSYKLISGSQYDNERNSQRALFINRQISLIDRAVSDYINFFNELKRIYVTGIYSPCYAIPGWSQNTGYLSLLKSSLLENKSD